MLVLSYLELPKIYNDIFQEAEVTLQDLININKFEGDPNDNKLYFSRWESLNQIIDEYLYEKRLYEDEVMD